MTSPLFATEKRAAELLDMSRSAFRRLVADGILPGPCAIGDQERWDVDALARAVRGELVQSERPKW
jgi:predicted DNA-binding transcriptional regulator AlpA